MFKKFGYFKEYYINGKYIGTINNVKKDRDIMGFYGRKSEIITEKLILSNKKIIKSQTNVTTQLEILCGKMN